MRTLLWIIGIVVVLPALIGIVRHFANPRRKEQHRLYEEGLEMGMSPEEALERAQRYNSDEFN